MSPSGILPHAQGRHEDFGIREIKENGLNQIETFRDNYAGVSFLEYGRLLGIKEKFRLKVNLLRKKR